MCACGYCAAHAWQTLPLAVSRPTPCLAPPAPLIASVGLTRGGGRQVGGAAGGRQSVNVPNDFRAPAKAEALVGEAGEAKAEEPEGEARAKSHADDEVAEGVEPKVEGDEEEEEEPGAEAQVQAEGGAG
jgi:hypothetical protein